MSEPEPRAIQSPYFQRNAHHPSPSNVTCAASDLGSNDSISASWPSTLPPACVNHTKAIARSPGRVKELVMGFLWGGVSRRERMNPEHQEAEPDSPRSSFPVAAAVWSYNTQSLALRKSPQDYEPHQGHSSAWVVSYRRVTHRNQTAMGKTLIHRQTYLNVSNHSVK